MRNHHRFIAFTSWILAGISVVAIATGCGKAGGSSPGSTELAGGLSADKPAEINSTISKSVEKSTAGSQGESGLGERSSRGFLVPRGVLGALSAINLKEPREECDSKGYPLAHEGEATDNQGGLSSSHPEYALRHFYCIMGHDSGSPETVQGAINGTNGILCALENGIGFTFDGVERKVDLGAAFLSDAAKKECGIQIGEEDLKMISAVEWTLTASSPAALNPNFARGVSVVGKYQGMTAMEFSVAGNVDTDKATILVRSGSADEKHYDGYAASLDFTTGQLRFDARFDRMGDARGGSGGWSRRIKLLAGLKLENGDVTGLESIEAFYSNAQSGGGYSNGGEIQTIQGSPETGIKTRSYGLKAENVSVADLLLPATYTESQDANGVKAGDLCFSNDGTATCAGMTGLTLDGLTSMDFLLLPGGGHVPVWTWIAGIKAVDYVKVGFAD